ncbi:hypothetical protein ACP70R_039983 [Stipagrostis hirtigluma subsp. patula]
MAASMALAHSHSLPLLLPPRRLAPNHPPLRAHRHLVLPLARTAKRPPVDAPRRLVLAARASLSAAEADPASGERGGGAAVGRKAAGYRNRFLDLARLGAVAEGAAEAFFRSEIRRRLAVTAVLIVLSRVGYFIPLPGFDRRLIPDSYLSFAALPADDLGDFSSELKLSFFQLGISHQISASIVMQVLCHVLPSLEKLRKEGLDGHEKIKGYMCMVAVIGFCNCGCFYCVMLFPAVLNICCKLQMILVKHIIVTTLLLVLGAMSLTWICDTISESGFGTWLISDYLCGNFDWVHKYSAQDDNSIFSRNIFKYWPYILGITGVFMTLTMGAVLVTEGCRKIKLQYYGFKLASNAGDESVPVTEVEPYIPFNINPTGMQPLLTTSYLLAFPSIMASIFGSRFWENMKEILNPNTSVGGSPWVYYVTYAFFVFVFNIFDIANLPKEISDYLNKMSARIPRIKPGRATVDYLIKVQTSTRFWGGILLSLLATSSLLLDRYLRQINEGFSIGFTSVLIIVGSIIELRRSYQAYNVMPALSKVLRRYGA